eukprot:1603147-Rhodomonas_salina.1
MAGRGSAGKRSVCVHAVSSADIRVRVPGGPGVARCLGRSAYARPSQSTPPGARLVADPPSAMSENICTSADEQVHCLYQEFCGSVVGIVHHVAALAVCDALTDTGLPHRRASAPLGTDGQHLQPPRHPQAERLRLPSRLLPTETNIYM